MINNKENKYRNFCLYMFGLLLSGLAVNLFYYPNDIVTTGTTGLSIIINHYINIDISLLVFFFSSILLVLGFAVFGIKYGAKNLLGTILYPIFLEATSLFIHIIKFDSSSLILLVIIGSVLYGFAFGIIKKSGYSLGGFYVLYDILNKYLKVSMGNANIICNSFIMVLSIFVFGLDKCIYAMIGVYITSIVADKVILGISRNKAFYIVTNKSNEVRDYIVNNLEYTATIVNAKGGYSNKRKKMLLCVIPTYEYVKLKEVVKEIDEKAFFLITDTYSFSKN